MFRKDGLHSAKNFDGKVEYQAAGSATARAHRDPPRIVSAHPCRSGRLMVKRHGDGPGVCVVNDFWCMGSDAGWVPYQFNACLDRDVKEDLMVLDCTKDGRLISGCGTYKVQGTFLEMMWIW